MFPILCWHQLGLHKVRYSSFKNYRPNLKGLRHKPVSLSKAILLKVFFSEFKYAPIVTFFRQFKLYWNQNLFNQPPLPYNLKLRAYNLLSWHGVMTSLCSTLRPSIGVLNNDGFWPGNVIYFRKFTSLCQEYILKRVYKWKIILNFKVGTNARYFHERIFE